MKVLIWLLMGSIGVVVICCLGFIGWSWWETAGPNPALHKLMMPGHYRLSLKPGNYQGWIYTTWRSRRVETRNDPHTLRVNIVNLKTKHSVAQELMDVYGADEADHKGEATSAFTISESGEYEVSADGPEVFVFVVVPREEVNVGMGSNWGYQGQFGDFNFAGKK